MHHTIEIVTPTEATDEIVAQRAIDDAGLVVVVRYRLMHRARRPLA